MRLCSRRICIYLTLGSTNYPEQRKVHGLFGWVETGGWHSNLKVKMLSMSTIEIITNLEGKNMISRRPTHPGEVLLEDVIKPLGLTVTKAAIMLGVSRKTLSELVNQKSSLSPEMALRIAKATKTSPDSWIKMQAKLDLWNALQHEPKTYRSFLKE